MNHQSARGHKTRDKKDKCHKCHQDPDRHRYPSSCSHQHLLHHGYQYFPSYGPHKCQKKGKCPPFILTNDVVYVDAEYGNDKTGQRENRTKPFTTLNAAMDVAEAGDTIIVWPGDYTANALNNADLTWQLTSGVIISCVEGSLFNGGDIRIRGEGILVSNAQQPLIAFSSGQNMIECDSISGTSGAELINISGPNTSCNIFIANDISTTTRPVLALLAGHCNLVVTTITTSGNNAAALRIFGGQLEANIQTISCQNSPCINMLGAAGTAHITVKNLSSTGQAATVDSLIGLLCLDFCNIRSGGPAISTDELANVKLKGGCIISDGSPAIFHFGGKFSGYIDELIATSGLAIFSFADSHLTINQIEGSVFYIGGNHIAKFGQILGSGSNAGLSIQGGTANVDVDMIDAGGVGLAVGGLGKAIVRAGKIQSTFLAIRVMGEGTLCLTATTVVSILGQTVIDFDSTDQNSALCICKLEGGTEQCVKKDGSGALKLETDFITTSGDVFVTASSGSFMARVLRAVSTGFDRSVVRSIGFGSNKVFIDDAQSVGPAITIPFVVFFPMPASHIYGGRYVSSSDFGVIVISTVPTPDKDIRLKNINLVSVGGIGPSINNATGQPILVKNYGTIIATTAVGGVPPPELLFPLNITVDSRVT